MRVTFDAQAGGTVVLRARTPSSIAVYLGVLFVSLLGIKIRVRPHHGAAQLKVAPTRAVKAQDPRRQ